MGFFENIYSAWISSLQYELRNVLCTSSLMQDTSVSQSPVTVCSREIFNLELTDMKDPCCCPCWPVSPMAETCAV